VGEHDRLVSGYDVQPRPSPRDDATASLLRAIDEILQRCESERHLYVKFYGD
jgi:hypothetical protein